MGTQYYDSGTVNQIDPVVLHRKNNEKNTEAAILFTYEQLEKIVEDTVDQVLEKRFKEIRDQVDKIKLDKEILRQSLIKAGYAIPEGLNMSQWVPYIEGRGRR